MGVSVRGKYVFCILSIAGIYIFSNIDSMWSWSVDLAHHYALAYRISEQWVLQSSMDLSLLEMSVYPRGSHILAATFGVLLNSTFLGIQFMTLISLVLIWSFVLLLLNSLPKTEARLSLAVFSAILIVNAKIGLNLHGDEVVRNFFFSQMVGHSVLFFGMFLAMNLEKRRGGLWSCAILLPLMLINAYIHLLPSLIMLGLIVGLVAVYVVFDIGITKLGLRTSLFPFSLIIFSVLGIMLHPSFSVMKSISGNNGELGMNIVSFPLGIIFLSISLIVTSSILFLKWLEVKELVMYAALKYLAIYGCVVAALCLFQYALTFIGYGSDYAVKKYIFSLSSIFLIQLSVLIALYISTFSSIRDIVNIPRLNIPIFSFCLLSVLFLSNPRDKLLDVSDIVLLEKKIDSLIATAVPVAEENKPNVIIGLEGLPSTIDYMFSIAMTKTMRSLASPDVLYRKRLKDLSNYSYVISSRGNEVYAPAECSSMSDSALSITLAQCIAQRNYLANTDCIQTFDFSLNGLVLESDLRGFSWAESNGRWTDGDNAIFRCRRSGATPKLAKIQLVPFLGGTLSAQTIRVLFDSELIHEETLRRARTADNPIIIDLDGISHLQELTFEFQFPDAASPKSVGYNDDERKIAFMFQKIVIE